MTSLIVTGGRHLLATGLLAALLVTSGPAAADPAATARAIARDLDLQVAPTQPQTEPTPEEPEAPPDVSWIPSEELARLVLWGAIALGIVLIAWSMRDALPGISRARKIRARDFEPDAAAPVAERMKEAQLEADDLARQGRIAEAMHVLLLRSLAELRRRLGLSFAASLTSREILRRIDLPDSGRAGLTDIVARVERAYFGGHAVEPADYEACRHSYEALTGALGRAAAA